MNPLKQVHPVKEYLQFRNDDPMSPILLFRSSHGRNYVLQFYPYFNLTDITFNEVWIEEAYLH